MDNYRLYLRLEGLPQRINQSARKHWAIQAKEARLWRGLVEGKVTLSMRPKYPLKKAKLKLTRHSSNRPDFDGLVSSCKHIIDGLIDANVIEDDNYDIIGMPEFAWVKAARGAGFIEIEVWGLPP